MKTRLFLPLWLLLSASIATPSPASTEREGCARAYARVVIDRGLLSQRLAMVPGLRAYVLDMLDDPNIPGSIQRILRVGLEDHNTHIFQITRRMRAELGLGEESFGAAYFNMHRPYEIRRDLVSSSGDPSRGLDRLARPPGYSVYVGDRLPRADRNDLITLIHELAHVRLDAFLRRYLPTNYWRFPDSLVSRNEFGRVEISQQFYTYLHERYAFETELSLFRSSRAPYVTVSSNNFLEQGLSPSVDRNIRRELNRNIREEYDIDSPDIQALDRYSFSEVLRGNFPQ